jgi:hypothetical protein
MGWAEPITDPNQIADFLEKRLKLHPKLTSAVLRIEGFGSTPSREQLVAYAKKRTMVAIQPTQTSSKR